LSQSRGSHENIENLVEDKEELREFIRKSKTDQGGVGQEIAIRHGRHLRPISAVKDWLEAAGIMEGPVFRPVSRSGRVRGDSRLTGKSVAEIVKGAGSWIRPAIRIPAPCAVTSAERTSSRNTRARRSRNTTAHRTKA
jgi:hypothetical protein